MTLLDAIGRALRELRVVVWPGAAPAFIHYGQRCHEQRRRQGSV